MIRLLNYIWENFTTLRFGWWTQFDFSPETFNTISVCFIIGAGILLLGNAWHFLFRGINNIETKEGVLMHIFSAILYMIINVIQFLLIAIIGLSIGGLIGLGSLGIIYLAMTIVWAFIQIGEEEEFDGMFSLARFQHEYSEDFDKYFKKKTKIKEKYNSYLNIEYEHN